jgi:hypothetical protein
MVFSSNVGEFVVLASIRLQVAGVDARGAEFELVESGLDSANMQNLTEPERAQIRQDVVRTRTSRFRVNFDGTREGDLGLAEELGLRVEVESEGGDRISVHHNWD